MAHRETSDEGKTLTLDDSVTLAEARNVARGLEAGSKTRITLERVERLASRLFDRQWNEQLEVEFKELANKVWGSPIVAVSKGGISITRSHPSGTADILFQMQWGHGRDAGARATRQALLCLAEEARLSAGRAPE